ncbi:helix-turn-helix domain-containing protein [Latilactobacillus curvatus]|uniref:helix-turn-helix domain-containing protein n=1 Tax=Latilactobacillus curvatus TaxID=28038 RepID=UPI0024104EA3|nr:helix-turn-helix transcriptional regulator [Latilactobacillus curvatus]MDG2980920.1 helix-turn-helix domain-containing protein [Latilactobacillus curvatus]WEU69500.1 Cro/CI family transcriptional regulator [Latilactobacillus phage TMW 1.1365 P2]
MTSLKDRIKQLASDHAMSIAELERKLNFANGSISKWDKQSPSMDRITVVADYFNVTTDYLIGRNQTPKDATEKETKELKNILQNEAGLTYSHEAVTPEDRAAIDSMIASYYWNKGRNRIFNDDQNKE